jgi:serine/threonine protein kinase
MDDWCKMDIWSVGCVAVELLTGHHPEDYLFETRGQNASLANTWSRIYQTRQMATACPERLRLDYLEHPLLKALPDRDKVLELLDACFELDAARRAAASDLLTLPLIKHAVCGSSA